MVDIGGFACLNSLVGIELIKNENGQKSVSRTQVLRKPGQGVVRVKDLL